MQPPAPAQPLPRARVHRDLAREFAAWLDLARLFVELGGEKNEGEKE